MSAPGPIRRSSTKDDWQTPQYIVDWIADELNVNFVLDVCADETNRKAKYWLEGPCVRWYSTTCYCGLCSGWCVHDEPGHSFCNPPYSTNVDRLWTRRAMDQMHRDRPSVQLVPAATGTAWWNLSRMMATATWLIEGRIPFTHPDREGASQNTSDSSLFLFDSSRRRIDKTLFLKRPLEA